MNMTGWLRENEPITSEEILRVIGENVEKNYKEIDAELSEIFSKLAGFTITISSVQRYRSYNALVKFFAPKHKKGYKMPPRERKPKPPKQVFLKLKCPCCGKDIKLLVVREESC